MVRVIFSIVQPGSESEFVFLAIIGVPKLKFLLQILASSFSVRSLSIKTCSPQVEIRVLADEG